MRNSESILAIKNFTIEDEPKFFKVIGNLFNLFEVGLCLESSKKNLAAEFYEQK
jgi:hypothetical protein